MRALAFVLVVACTGCEVLFPDSDCATDGTDYFFDPQAGACVEVGSADACYYCGGTGCVVASTVTKDYPSCFGVCASAPEAMCLDQPGCHATYAGGSFDRCVSTAPSGPIHDGVCAGFDAHACARHDNCAAWFLHLSDGAMLFDHCADEVTPSR